MRFRLIPFRSPLLRESQLLSFPRGTEMFQFPRFPLPALCVQTGVTPDKRCRVSPFGYPRINAWSAAPRGFSQPPTSFIGSRRQGIHRWLFVAWKNKDARARYAVLKGHRATGTQALGGWGANRRSAPGGVHHKPDSHWAAGEVFPQNGREAVSPRPIPPPAREGGCSTGDDQCINWDELFLSLARPKWPGVTSRDSLERR
jgi:hypothetical protein